RTSDPSRSTQMMRGDRADRTPSSGISPVSSWRDADMTIRRSQFGQEDSIRRILNLRSGNPQHAGQVSKPAASARDRCEPSETAASEAGVAGWPTARCFGSSFTNNQSKAPSAMPMVIVINAGSAGTIGFPVELTPVEKRSDSNQNRL